MNLQRKNCYQNQNKTNHNQIAWLICGICYIPLRVNCYLSYIEMLLPSDLLEVPNGEWGNANIIHTIWLKRTCHKSTVYCNKENPSVTQILQNLICLKLLYQLPNRVVIFRQYASIIDVICTKNNFDQTTEIDVMNELISARFVFNIVSDWYPLL